MKISIIMQSYLGDYPNARANPEEGFIRAVYSVINQTVSNWELIIVADGCSGGIRQQKPQEMLCRMEK